MLWDVGNLWGYIYSKIMICSYKKKMLNNKKTSNKSRIVIKRMLVIIKIKKRLNDENFW